MFSVEDSGIGIDAADRESLFSPFSRIEKSTKGIVGTGLGLVISKRLIELMGGEIKFVSEPNQGSNFWFWIPFGTVPEESRIISPIVSALSKQPELLSRHRILVVEDNAVLSELASRQLAMLGARSDCVFNGTDALAAWQKTRYDIILLDIHLPDVNGHEVARRIRTATGKIPHHDGGPVIIAMTAGAMPGDREKALESGMNDYLSKPVNLSQLGETVIKWATRIEAHEIESTGTQPQRAGAS
jgi:CheY-like chemotaxis protein